MFHVVAREQILVAQEQLAIRDDRVRPDFALFAAFLGLCFEFEAAVFFPACGRGIDQDHFAVALVKAIQPAVGSGDAPLTENSPLAPNDSLPVLNSRQVQVFSDAP